MISAAKSHKRQRIEAARHVIKSKAAFIVAWNAHRPIEESLDVSARLF